MWLLSGAGPSPDAVPGRDLQEGRLSSAEAPHRAPEHKPLQSVLLGMCPFGVAAARGRGVWRVDVAAGAWEERPASQLAPP